MCSGLWYAAAGQLVNPFKDGGCVDRIGLTAWRDRRRQQLGIPKALPDAVAAGDVKEKKKGQKEVPPCLVHIIGK